MNNGLLSILAFVGIAAGAHGQVTRVKGGYLLRVKYTKGQTINLNTANTAEGLGNTVAGGKLQFKTPITMSVLDVKDGFARIRLKLGAVMQGGKLVSAGQTAVVRLDSRNQPKDSESPTNLGATLPEKPLKVGQTWSGMVPISTGMGTGKLNASYRFAGVKNLGGTSVAVITYRVSGFADGTGNMTLFAKDGTLKSNQMKLSIKGISNKPITVTSVMTRA